VGEAVAGDVVNTTSRMQSLAPLDSVVIGEATLRAVRDRFDLEALPPATVKGKSEPLRVWRVVAERAETDIDRTPFVGRRAELAALTERFDEVVRSGASHALTIVADAGVGKSRLVVEFARGLGDRARRLAGTCLPYGEGVTFAPVEQTVRELVGVAPSADAAASAGLLEVHAARIEADPDDRRWLVRTLGMVLGVEATLEGPSLATDEIAQAWARVLGAAAEERPLVLVIEDLHDAMSAFGDVLVAAAELLRTAPVLILATTRPHAASRLAALERSSTLVVGALDEDETRALVGSVLLEREVSEAMRAALLERSAGNPLYAIEFARMLAEGEAADVAPPSVQALIAARLDAVPAGVRALALDAAVLGDEVWPEALVSSDGRALGDVRDGLEELVRRGLMVTRPSSLSGRDAFGFAHGLIREVAYGRLPRAARARRHLSVARWLEAEVAGRGDEWIESLARHYGSAAELGGVSGERDVAGQASGPAVRWLVAAGDRAARIDPAAAFATFERALALASAGTPERAEALLRSGAAGRRSGLLDARQVLARHEEALGIAQARDDADSVGEALTRIGTQLAVIGEVERSRAAFAEAVETLERLPPGPALARAYAYRAEEELFAGDTAHARRFAERALELLEDVRDEVAVFALQVRGDARCSMGDLDAGLADLRAALRWAEEAGNAADIVASRNFLGEWRWATEGPAAGLAEWEMGLELAERRNVRSLGTYTKGAALWVLLELGEWDRVVGWSDDLLALPPGLLDPAVSVAARATRAHVLLARGRRSQVPDPEELVRDAERTEEVAAHAHALVAAAAIALADGRAERAVALLDAFASVTEDVAPEYRAIELVRAVRLCIACGQVDLAERLATSVEPHVLRDRLRRDTAEAMVAEARGEAGAGQAYALVAERLRTNGDPYEEAMALLGQARLTGAEQPRERARVLLERLQVPG
jgi:tetratricopeptide (TPR) repeat protein